MSESKRRGNNEGSIRYRKNQKTWEGRYTAMGKQHSVTAKTREECNRKLRAILSKLDSGEYISNSNMTVAQWLNTWMLEYASPSLRASTYTVQRKIVDQHLIPALGSHKLQQLRADHVQSFVNRQKQAGFAPSTIKRRMSVLKTALKQAVDNRLIPYNPATPAKLPKQEQRDINPLSSREQQALLQILPSTTHGRAIRFILGTGLRVSELCGLRWCDVDKDGFHVNQVTYCVKRGTVDDSMGIVDPRRGDAALRIVNPPKTKAGKRFIPLHPKLWATLEDQRQQQRMDRLRAGSAWQGGEPGNGEQYIFATSIGTPAERHNVARALRECLKKAGIEPRGVHALRHTFASNWVQQGGDLRTLSEILGHTKVAFTMQQYVHSNNDIKKKWMEEMAELL